MTESLRIYEALRNEIILCRLEPGAAMSESELCSRYEAGRTPLREACRRLQEEVLLHIVPFRGYFIPPLTIDEYQDLSGAQLVIEPEVAAMAAQVWREDNQIRRIEKLADYEYHLGEMTSYYKFLEVNREFHGEIAAVSGNEILREVVVNLQARLMRYYYKVISLDNYGKDLVNEHREIAQAIRRRNSEEARESSKHHLEKTAERSSNLSFGAQRWHSQPATALGRDNGRGSNRRRR